MKYYLMTYVIQQGQYPAEYFNAIVTDEDRFSILRGQQFRKMNDHKARYIVVNMLEISKEEYMQMKANE